MTDLHAKAQALIDRANAHHESAGFRPDLDLDERLYSLALVIAEEITRLESCIKNRETLATFEEKTP